MLPDLSFVRAGDGFGQPRSQETSTPSSARGSSCHLARVAGLLLSLHLLQGERLYLQEVMSRQCCEGM